MTRTEGRLDDLAAVGPFFAVETHPPGTGPTAVNLLKEVIASLIAGIEPGHRLAPGVLGVTSPRRPTKPLPRSPRGIRS